MPVVFGELASFINLESSIYLIEIKLSLSALATSTLASVIFAVTIFFRSLTIDELVWDVM